MVDSNLEALANIGANLAEIVGVAGGFTSLAGSWIPVVNKYPGLCKGMLVRGALILGAAMAQPGIVEYLKPINEIAATIASWVLCVPIVIFALKAYALPGSIALKRDLKHKKWIILLNCLVIVPFHLAWFVSLYLATAKYKTDSAKSVSENVPQSDDENAN